MKLQFFIESQIRRLHEIDNRQIQIVNLRKELRIESDKLAMEKRDIVTTLPEDYRPRRGRPLGWRKNA